MADPLLHAVAPSRRSRLVWRWRCRWAERQGRVERDAAVLHRIRTELTGSRLAVGSVDGAVSELVFDSGLRLRLCWSHRPTLRRLRDAASDETIRLVRADHPGRLWALYVGTSDGVVPLLSGDLRLLSDQGGVPLLTPQ